MAKVSNFCLHAEKSFYNNNVTSIALKCGTYKECIKLNSHTKFAKNLINIHSYMGRSKLLPQLQSKLQVGINRCVHKG